MAEYYGKKDEKSFLVWGCFWGGCKKSYIMPKKTLFYPLRGSWD
jgi:hypothetical protein